MTLAEFLLRSTLGEGRAPNTLQVALFRGAVEVRDPGYRRFELLKGSWKIEHNKALNVAFFGQFRGRVNYDRSVVFDGTQVIDEKLLPGGTRTADATDMVRLDLELDLTPPKYQ